MKAIRITVTQEVDAPDDVQIIEHPDDQVSCLRAGGKFWLPIVQWVRFKKDAKPRFPDEKPGSGKWIQDDKGPPRIELKIENAH